jgi:hypothetical protein
MAKKKQSETQRLRRFAIVMAVAFAALGALLLWRGREWGDVFFYVAAFFLLSGLIAPRQLAPIERVWMKLAHLLGTVMTAVILTLTFFLVITPMGIVLRLIGKDLLGMRGDPDIATYWVPVEEDGPCSRPDKPY